MFENQFKEMWLWDTIYSCTVIEAIAGLARRTNLTSTKKVENTEGWTTEIEDLKAYVIGG